MHSITELKEHMISLGYKIKESQGWYMIVGKDRYTMLDGDFYLNKERLTKKELLNRLKNKPKPIPKPVPEPQKEIIKPKAKKKAKAKKPKKKSKKEK